MRLHFGYVEIFCVTRNDLWKKTDSVHFGLTGDIRFAARVKQLLGQKVLVKPSEAYRDPDFEPLSDRVLKQLQVHSNRSIPLMLHLSEIRLLNFYKKNPNLIIRTNQLPDHFNWTLKALGLDEIPLEIKTPASSVI